MSGLEGDGQEIVVFVFLPFGVSGIEGEQSFEDEESPARRAEGTTDWSGGAPLLEAHQPRTLRRAPVCKVPPIEGARGQGQYQSNSQGRLASMWR